MLSSFDSRSLITAGDCRVLSSELICVMLSGLKVGFILHATGSNCGEETIPFMRNVVKEAVETLGYEPGKFAVMARAEGQVHSINFQDKQPFFKVMTAPTEAPWKALALEKCLKEMDQLFKQTDGEKVRACYSMSNLYPSPSLWVTKQSMSFR